VMPLHRRRLSPRDIRSPNSSAMLMGTLFSVKKPVSLLDSPWAFPGLTTEAPAPLV
jgi:hypothetical protein